MTPGDDAARAALETLRAWARARIERREPVVYITLNGTRVVARAALDGVGWVTMRGAHEFRQESAELFSEVAEAVAIVLGR